MSENKHLSAYHVDLPIFDGPLDLLLHLIRKNRIDIYDIPIHIVTDQYMGYLRRAEEFNLQLGTEFFELASTLLAIKSRMLLPKVEEETDPREELVQRLEEWEQIINIKNSIEEGFREREDFLERGPTHIRSVRFKGDLSMQRLRVIWQRLQEVEITDEVHFLAGETVSVIEAKEELLAALRAGNVYLLKYLSELPTRLYRITVFLLILELVKQDFLLIEEDIDGIYVGRKRE